MPLFILVLLPGTHCHHILEICMYQYFQVCSETSLHPHESDELSPVQSDVLPQWVSTQLIQSPSQYVYLV